MPLDLDHCHVIAVVKASRLHGGQDIPNNFVGLLFKLGAACVYWMQEQGQQLADLRDPLAAAIG